MVNTHIVQLQLCCARTSSAIYLAWYYQLNKLPFSSTHAHICTQYCSGVQVNSDVMTVEAMDTQESVESLSDIRITFPSLNTVSSILQCSVDMHMHQPWFE